MMAKKALKMTINTEVLKGLVQRAAKGAIGNNLAPITNMMELELIDGNLRLTTTDLSSYLSILQGEVTGDNMRIVLTADIFSRLVGRTTSENITITQTELESVVIKGNGTYTLPLPLDGNGDPVRFKDIDLEWKKVKGKTVNLSALESLLRVNKASIARGVEAPCYTGYYCGEDSVVTTDRYKVCRNAVRIFDDTTLLQDSFVELFAVLLDEKVTLKKKGDAVMVKTPSAVIVGEVNDDIENFAIDAINNLIYSEFPYYVVLHKAALLEAIERITLFMDEQVDKGALNLLFTKKGLELSTMGSKNNEVIAYQDDKQFSPFEASIDVTFFKDLIKVQPGDSIDLWYGSDVAVKMATDFVSQVVALYVENEEEEEYEDTEDETEDGE
jgi:DNA polymerase III sliding clamp (beta) subunit (PCNA family)